MRAGGDGEVQRLLAADGALVSTGDALIETEDAFLHQRVRLRELDATERHAAGRIDRQLYGRCGRQGDPGSYQYLVSVQDELVASGWLQRPAVLLGSVLGDRSAGLLGKWMVVAS